MGKKVTLSYFNLLLKWLLMVKSHKRTTFRKSRLQRHSGKAVITARAYYVENPPVISSLMVLGCWVGIWSGIDSNNLTKTSVKSVLRCGIDIVSFGTECATVTAISRILLIVKIVK